MQISFFITYILYFFCDIYLKLLFFFFLLYNLHHSVLTHFLYFVFSKQQLHFNFRYLSFNFLKSWNFCFLCSFKNYYIFIWIYIFTLFKFNLKFHIGFIYRYWFFLYYQLCKKLYIPLIPLFILFNLNTSLTNTTWLFILSNIKIIWYSRYKF